MCAHLKSHKALLIIDNCEHLVSACANFAIALLRAAPDVRIIATSREALRVPGEQTYPVLPLAVPNRQAGLETVLRSDAVVLFAERARLLRPDFAVTARNAAAVAELVSRLEGIPLALELAAARLRSMTIDDINARLKDRFKLLTGGSRVALARQQKLRALVQWSYDLLQPDEARLLDRLSVFSGGFDLAAAETVAGIDPLDPLDILDLVTSLVEKSLVQIDQASDKARYGMLETIREFSRERLQASGELDAMCARHCDCFLALVKTARDRLQGAEQAEWTRRLEKELDNGRAAISLSLAGRVDTVIEVKYVVALMRFWTLRGYSTEGRDIVRAALKLPAIAACRHARSLLPEPRHSSDQSCDARAKKKAASRPVELSCLSSRSFLRRRGRRRHLRRRHLLALRLHLREVVRRHAVFRRGLLLRRQRRGGRRLRLRLFRGRLLRIRHRRRRGQLGHREPERTDDQRCRAQCLPALHLTLPCATAAVQSLACAATGGAPSPCVLPAFTSLYQYS